MTSYPAKERNEQPRTVRLNRSHRLMLNINNKRESHNAYLLTLLNSARSIPVRTLALWANTRLNFYVAWNPFMLASFATETPSRNFYLVHIRSIYLENISCQESIYTLTSIYFNSNIVTVVSSKNQTVYGSDEMSEREQKALEIAARTKIKKNGKNWIVPSQTGNGTQYKVDEEIQQCSCPDYETRQLKCKHMYAVEYTIERERSITQTVKGDTTITTVTETVKLRYKQVWSAYNTAQVNEKARFLVLLHELCSGIDEPIQNMGRTRLLMADMIFAAAYKVYSSMSTRRFMSDLKEAYMKQYLS